MHRHYTTHIFILVVCNAHVHVFMSMGARARRGCAARGAEGCAKRGPQTSGRAALRAAPKPGVMEGCAVRGLPGAIKKVALRATFRSHREEGCAARGLPRAIHVQEVALRAASGSCAARWTPEGLGRFFEAAQRAASGSAEWLKEEALGRCIVDMVDFFTYQFSKL